MAPLPRDDGDTLASRRAPRRLLPLALFLLALAGCQALPISQPARKPPRPIIFTLPRGEPPRVIRRERLAASLLRVRYDNGLTLIIDHQPQAPTVAVQTWIGAGSRQETARQSGVAHLLEHLAFRGAGRFSAEAIRAYARRHGGMLNAETFWEHTRYFALTPAYAWHEAAELVAELVLRPRLPFDVMEPEKRVVIEEIKRAHDDPRAYGLLTMARHAFPGHPLGRPVFGAKKSVLALSWNDVIDFYRRFYQPERMVVVLSGRLDVDEAIHRIASLYAVRSASAARTTPAANAPTAPSHLSTPRDPTPHRVTPGRVTSSRVTPKARAGAYTIRRLLLGAYVAVGAQTVPHDHADAPALDILDTLLAGGRFAALPRRLVAREGSATIVQSMHMPISDSGMWGLYAATTRSKVPDVLEAVAQVFQRYQRNPPEADELRRAKQAILGALARGLATSHQRASFFGRQALLGAVRPLAAERQRLLAVTADDVRRVARHYLQPSRLLTFRLLSWRGPRRWFGALGYLF